MSCSIKEGYFLRWEAVVRDEQGLPLSEKQQEALDGLLDFGDDDTPILYTLKICNIWDPVDDQNFWEATIEIPDTSTLFIGYDNE